MSGRPCTPTQAIYVTEPADGALPRVDVYADDGPVVTGAGIGTALDHIVDHINGVVIDRGTRLLLHAGALALRGRAALFVGPSGAGKSTLVAQLLMRHPVAYLTDEAVAVLPSGRVEGFPKPVSLKAGTVTVFPDLPLAPDLDGARTRFLDPAVLEGRIARFAAPGLIALPRRIDTGGLQMRPLEAAEALMAIVGESSHLGAAHRGLPSLAALLSGSECLEVTYQDAAEAADAVAERLGQLEPVDERDLPEPVAVTDEVDLDGDIVLAIGKRVHRLSGAAAAIWRLLPLAPTRGALISAIAAENDAPADTVSADLDGVLASLREIGAVVDL